MILNIREDINTIAKKVFLSERFTGDEVKLFIQSVERFASEALDSTLHERVRDERILANVRADEYQDFSTGYKRQMDNWIEAHPIEIKKYDFDVEAFYQSLQVPEEEKPLYKRYLLEAGIGTIVAIGISFLVGPILGNSLVNPVSTNPLISPVLGIGKLIAFTIAELIVLSTVYVRYRKAKSEAEAFKAKSIQMKIEARKNKLINDISDNLSEWLTLAEHESDRIESTFKK